MILSHHALQSMNSKKKDVLRMEDVYTKFSGLHEEMVGPRARVYMYVVYDCQNRNGQNA